MRLCRRVGDELVWHIPVCAGMSRGQPAVQGTALGTARCPCPRCERLGLPADAELGREGLETRSRRVANPCASGRRRRW